MTQAQQVINTMREIGGFATLGKLNSVVDFSGWKTKTPEASIRRIVQQSPEIFRIRPGLWGLTERKDEILTLLNLSGENNDRRIGEKFDHSYYQGLIVEIGNMRSMKTYIPPQDRNKLFLERPLHEAATHNEVLDFTYPGIVNRAKTVDVIWLNERKMPFAFFEVEHSTDIQNSLLKYYELQDFFAKFYIVADERRETKFEEILNRSVFLAIRKRIKFVSYRAIAEQHTNTCRTVGLQVI
jgi:hypothetical protein